MALTDDQRIAILVYKEDHPEAYPPELADATGVSYGEVIHTLREHEASRQRFKIKVNTEFFDKATAERLESIIHLGMEDLVGRLFQVLDQLGLDLDLARGAWW